MNATPKKKLCWNCEGRVDLELENCPYCAVYLGPAPDDEGERTDNILAPPYKLVDSEEGEGQIPISPYALEEVEEKKEEVVEEVIEEVAAEPSEIKKVAFPLAFLSGGVIFFPIWSYSSHLFRQRAFHSSVERRILVYLSPLSPPTPLFRLENPPPHR